MKSNHSSTGLAIALACVVLGAACNDDNDNITAAPVPTPPPAAAPEPTPAPTPTPTAGPTAGEEVSFLGKVRATDGNVVRVNADDVIVDATTRLQREDGTPISMADLAIGSSVRVRGMYNDTVTAILAERITVLS